MDKKFLCYGTLINCYVNYHYNFITFFLGPRAMGGMICLRAKSFLVVKVSQVYSKEACAHYAY